MKVKVKFQSFVSLIQDDNERELTVYLIYYSTSSIEEANASLKVNNIGETTFNPEPLPLVVKVPEYGAEAGSGASPARRTMPKGGAAAFRFVTW